MGSAMHSYVHPSIWSIVGDEEAWESWWVFAGYSYPYGVWQCARHLYHALRYPSGRQGVKVHDLPY
jgi:hypothetical protein